MTPKTEAAELTLPPEIENPMRQHLNFEALKFACGQGIFCKGCEQVLDCYHATQIDFTGANSGTLHATYTLCNNCADKRLPGIRERLGEAEKRAKEPLKISTIDGRDYTEDPETGIAVFNPLPQFSQGAPGLFKAARPPLLRGGSPEVELVNGFEVLGLPDWAGLYAYDMSAQPSTAGKDPRWYIVEKTTGLALNSPGADSFREAATVTWRRLQAHGKEQFLKRLEQQPKLA